MKIDVLPIVRDQWKTMVDSRTGKSSWYDFVIFYGLPLVLVLPAIKYRWAIGKLDVALAALALMTGLLFNLQVLLFDVIVRIGEGSGGSVNHRRELVRQVQVNVTYALLVALVATGLLTWLALAGVGSVSLPWSAILIFLLAHFGLLLVMILRRVRAAFLREVKARRDR